MQVHITITLYVTFLSKTTRDFYIQTCLKQPRPGETKSVSREMIMLNRCSLMRFRGLRTHKRTMQTLIRCLVLAFLNLDPYLIFADLSAGFVEVLPSTIWKLTKYWYAGNIMCKLLRFCQVGELVTVTILILHI